MTILDATVATAQGGRGAPAGGVVRFRGESRSFWRLLTHGAVLLMLTLGIYRFWLTTDIRRFLWSNTELADESFEYGGTAGELLLGKGDPWADIKIDDNALVFTMAYAKQQGIWPRQASSPRIR